MSLTGKWINLIYKVATGSWKKKLILAPIVGAFYLSLMALFIMLSFMTDKFLQLPKAVFRPWSPVIGICLIILGFSLAFLAVSHFIRVRGTPVPLCPPPKLITTGPCGLIRNPMLSGLFLQLFGLGVYLGSLSLVFVFTPLFIIMNVWELKTIEEPELVKRLGQDYAEYKNRVPVFFPFHMKRSNRSTQ